MMEITNIPVDDIVVKDRMRAVDKGVVILLSENIAQNGLKHPIGVNKNRRTGKWDLIYGAHRLAAIKRLGESEIACVIKDVSANTARIFEIDENFIRTQFKPLEFAKAYLARKAIYENVFPDTKHGGNRLNRILSSDQESQVETLDQDRQVGGLGQECQVGTLENEPAFIQFAAERLGFSTRKIERYIALHKKIKSSVAVMLADHPTSASYAELERLSNQTHSTQETIAEFLIADDRFATVTEVLKHLNKKVAERTPGQVYFDRIAATWDRCDERAQIETLEWFSTLALPAGYKVVREEKA